MINKTPPKYELTEPDTVLPIFVTGSYLYADKRGNVGLGFYIDLQSVRERRILARLVMSADTANELYLSLWKALRKIKPRVPAPPKL